jgi:hypothetical protein
LGSRLGVNPVAPVHVEIVGDLVQGNRIPFEFAVGVGGL